MHSDLKNIKEREKEVKNWIKLIKATQIIKTSLSPKNGNSQQLLLEKRSSRKKHGFK